MRFPLSSVQLVAFALTAPLVASFSLLPLSPSSGVAGAVRSLPEPLTVGGVPSAPVMPRRMVATNAEAEAVAAAEAEAEMGQKRKKTKEVRICLSILLLLVLQATSRASSLELLCLLCDTDSTQYRTKGTCITTHSVVRCECQCFDAMIPMPITSIRGTTFYM